ncbi:hypothetical protein GGTG_01186 [Gaeumannomyces tritici R3-111a-1]|uniref:Uncharacterized protein n=1 Tax=Gaeumannomyces tritici (strain R3-111a-1) TaxID=644352 RepID=J3NIV2_GAET3|nr:hypothetical protein GGTG_01186 [Gaeumannomyces tritici R3-111a-1]EJT81202.1 hypothetical protein GGTG_01186 [Gaeumannomyces tritici R3-111a-1]
MTSASLATATSDSWLVHHYLFPSSFSPCLLPASFHSAAETPAPFRSSHTMFVSTDPPAVFSTLTTRVGALVHVVGQHRVLFDVLDG